MIVWSDESKFNVFRNDVKQYVRRPPNKQLNPKYTKKIVKNIMYVICNIVCPSMVWGCFTSSELGALVKIEGIMNCEMYTAILRYNFSGESGDNLPLA